MRDVFASPKHFRTFCLARVRTPVGGYPLHSARSRADFYASMTKAGGFDWLWDQYLQFSEKYYPRLKV